MNDNIVSYWLNRNKSFLRPVPVILPIRFSHCFLKRLVLKYKVFGVVTIHRKTIYSMDLCVRQKSKLHVHVLRKIIS